MASSNHYLVKRHLRLAMGPFSHYRVLFPVGHGGFAFEYLNEFSIIYDCGSDTAPTRVKQYVDLLKQHDIKRIDYLVLSHFDRDHVNCIDYLTSQCTVKNLLAPCLPTDVEIVYNVVTDNTVARIKEICRKKEIIYAPIEQEEFFLAKHDLWEWHIKSVLTSNDFGLLRTQLTNQGIDIKMLKNSNYVIQNRRKINCAFASFGYGGSNAKGLIMLSQISNKAYLLDGELKQGCTNQKVEEIKQTKLISSRLTGCLYVGDADLNKQNLSMVNNFLNNKLHGDTLLLMQIPHHGSRYNINNNFNQQFPAERYFLCDVDDKRVSKNATLWNTIKNQTLQIRDVCSDIFIGEIHVG